MNFIINRIYIQKIVESKYCIKVVLILCFHDIIIFQDSKIIL